MPKVTRKTEKVLKPLAGPPSEIELDDAEIPFPSSNSTPEEVEEFFDKGKTPEPDEEPEVEFILVDDGPSVGRITAISYKTNKNLGNMEHESVELTYDVLPDEDSEDVFSYLRETAEYLLNVERVDR